MSKKKELDLEDLEEVTGGTSQRYEKYKAEYKDRVTGETGYHELEKEYYQTVGKVLAETDAKKWCLLNNKTFICVKTIGSYYKR